MIRDKSNTVFIRDKASKRGGTSRAISKAECAKIFDDPVGARRMYFVFRELRPLEVDKALGRYLLQKFPSLEVVNVYNNKTGEIEDDLNDLKYQRLTQLLSLYNKAAIAAGHEKVKVAAVSAPEARKSIRELRKKGVKIKLDKE
jgi:hypothetical protein